MVTLRTLRCEMISDDPDGLPFQARDTKHESTDSFHVLGKGERILSGKHTKGAQSY